MAFQTDARGLPRNFNHEAGGGTGGDFSRGEKAPRATFLVPLPKADEGRPEGTARNAEAHVRDHELPEARLQGGEERGECHLRGARPSPLTPTFPHLSSFRDEDFAHLRSQPRSAPGRTTKRTFRTAIAPVDGVISARWWWSARGYPWCNTRYRGTADNPWGVSRGSGGT